MQLGSPWHFDSSTLHSTCHGCFDSSTLHSTCHGHFNSSTPVHATRHLTRGKKYHSRYIKRSPTQLNLPHSHDCINVAQSMDCPRSVDPCFVQRNPWIVQIHALCPTYTCISLLATRISFPLDFYSAFSRCSLSWLVLFWLFTFYFKEIFTDY